MIGRLTLLLVLLVPLTVAAPWAPRASQSSVASGGIDYETMRKDLETMRRLLTRDAPGTKGLAFLGDVNAYTYSVDGGSSDAVYAAGVGPIFMLRSSIVLAPGEQADEAKDVKDPSPWDEVRAELDGKPLTKGHRNAAYDSDAVEKLRSNLLSVLAKYGSKIGQVPEDQHLTVVVRSTAGALRLRAPKAAKGESTTEAPAGVTDMRGRFELATMEQLFQGAGFSGRTVLTIAVRQGDCAAFAEGKLDMDAFSKKAHIAQY